MRKSRFIHSFCLMKILINLKFDRVKIINLHHLIGIAYVKTRGKREYKQREKSEFI